MDYLHGERFFVFVRISMEDKNEKQITLFRRCGPLSMWHPDVKMHSKKAGIHITYFLRSNYSDYPILSRSLVQNPSVLTHCDHRIIITPFYRYLAQSYPRPSPRVIPSLLTILKIADSYDRGIHCLPYRVPLFHSLLSVLSCTTLTNHRISSQTVIS